MGPVLIAAPTTCEDIAVAVMAGGAEGTESAESAEAAEAAEGKEISVRGLSVVVASAPASPWAGLVRSVSSVVTAASSFLEGSTDELTTAAQIEAALHRMERGKQKPTDEAARLFATGGAATSGAFIEQQLEQWWVTLHGPNRLLDDDVDDAGVGIGSPYELARGSCNRLAEWPRGDAAGELLLMPAYDGQQVADRGVTPEWCQAVIERPSIGSVPTRVFVAIVKLLTARHRCTLYDLIPHRFRATPHTFVSHSWDGHLADCLSVATGGGMSVGGVLTKGATPSTVCWFE